MIQLRPHEADSGIQCAVAQSFEHVVEGPGRQIGAANDGEGERENVLVPALARLQDHPRVPVEIGV